MQAIIVNEAKIMALGILITDLLEGCFLRLFKNDYTPISTSELGDFTELTGASDGYAEKELTGWGSPTLGADGFYSVVLPPESFTNSGGSDWEECFGFYYVDPGGTTILSAGRFDASVVLASGLTIPIVPQYALGSEF